MKVSKIVRNIDQRRKRTNMGELLKFGLKIFVTIGITFGPMIAILIGIGDVAEYAGFLIFNTILITSPIIALVISFIIGKLAVDNKEARRAGAITGGIGFCLMFLLIFILPFGMYSESGNISFVHDIKAELVVTFLAAGSVFIGYIGALLSERVHRNIKLNEIRFDQGKNRKPNQNKSRNITFKYCPECGNELEETFKHCPECGQKIR